MTVLIYAVSVTTGPTAFVVVGLAEVFVVVGGFAVVVEVVLVVIDVFLVVVDVLMVVGGFVDVLIVVGAPVRIAVRAGGADVLVEAAGLVEVDVLAGLESTGAVSTPPSMKFFSKVDRCLAPCKRDTYQLAQRILGPTPPQRTRNRGIIDQTAF